MMFICVNWDTQEIRGGVPTWDHVLQATNRDFQGSTDKVTRDGKAKNGRIFEITKRFSSTQIP